MEKVIVRFAPSPTGYLHIGGARTAIFNWLYARKHNGKFILRIEDTDADRSSENSVQGILDGLTWLGLDWDEGPCFQSRSMDAHRAAAQKLLDIGAAYPCFCSKETLDSRREAARRAKRTYRYDGTCRHLSADTIARKKSDGMPYTIRLKVPDTDGGVCFADAVYGDIEKRYRDLEDFVIVRSNGMPLYVLSNAVDDISDGITHVIRGQDGLANTPKQILIYQALGAPLPRFAHMSLTLDPKKAKISKRRHGEKVSIQYYREHGFLPWAMVNFLVLLGWATPASEERFSREELIDAFDLNGIGKTNSIFDLRSDSEGFATDPKLMNINAHYLRTMPVEDLLPHLRGVLEREGLWDPAFAEEKRGWLMETVELIRGRYHRLTDFADYGRAFFTDDFPVDPKAAEKHLVKRAEMADLLPQLADCMEQMPVYDAPALESMLLAYCRDHGVKTGALVNAVRVAVTGQGVGPGFMDVLVALGRVSVVKRLRNVRRFR